MKVWVTQKSIKQKARDGFGTQEEEFSSQYLLLYSIPIRLQGGNTFKTLLLSFSFAKIKDLKINPDHIWL